MRHPSNRGERKAARDKFRRKVTDEERYDSGRKSRENGPDFNPDNRDRKAVKQRAREWQMAAKFLPPGATELSEDDLYFGGRAAGGDDYVKF